MSIDARLNKLMPAFTGRERAILDLRSLKDKTPKTRCGAALCPRNRRGSSIA